MSVEIRVRQATIDDAEWFTRLLRKEDREELEATGDPQAQLAFSIKASYDSTWLVTFDGKPAAIFGVMPVSLLTGCAVPWLLTTDAVDRYPKTFYKICKQTISMLRERHTLLGNVTDARYEKALRWARHLGFHVSDPEPIGPNQAMFCRITLGG